MMGFSLGKLNPFSNTGINKKISNTVQTAVALPLSLGTFGMANTLTSKSAQESNLGKISTVAGQVATTGAVVYAGGAALAGGLASGAIQSAGSTAGEQTVATIAETTTAPTIYDQLKGIVVEGVKTATGNAVNRATGQRPATVSEQFTGAAQSVPVWGWVIGALAVAGLAFMLARKS